MLVDVAILLLTKVVRYITSYAEILNQSIFNGVASKQLNDAIKHHMKVYGEAENVYGDIKMGCNVAMKHVKVYSNYKIEFCSNDKNDDDQIEFSNEKQLI